MKRKNVIPPPSKKSILLIVTGLINLFSLIHAQNLKDSWMQHSAMEKRSMFNTIQWNRIGPSFQGGRIETLESPYNQPGVIYAGFGSGGLWKSTDQGLSWKQIFKNEATFSIGDLAISFSQPQVLYLGTGEVLRASRGYTYPGYGMYKSTNGGKSWISIGLTDSHHIGRVVIDPANPDLVFVAVIGHFWSPNPQRGVFITHNGGKTWDHALALSDSIGAVDVAWDAINKILYAATWEIPAGRGSGIYKSTDLGKNWKRLTNGLPVDSTIGRIGIAISPSQPNILYTCIDHRQKLNDHASQSIKGAEVYHSFDFGATWQKTHTGLLNNYSGFGFAFGDIKISPVDPDEIYLLGIKLLHSTNGGQNFEPVEGNIVHLRPNRGTHLHLDQHDLYIDPVHPERLILGNDGGVFISYDKGAHWLHCNNIPVAEFYDLYVDDKGPTPTGYGGTQDNSCLFGPIELTNPPLNPHTWQYVWLDPWAGGDGFTTMPDPAHPDRIFYESQNGALNRKNMVTWESKFIRPKTDDPQRPLRTTWFTPYFVSEHQATTLYYGANKVFKSMDSGDHWLRASPDLTYSKDPDRKSRSLTFIAESPLTAGLLYAGTEKGAVWISRDDGIHWIEISKGLPVNKVNYITPSVHDEKRVFIAMKGLDNDDYRSYLYVSDNQGKKWRLISGGLPDEPVNCLLEDPALNGLIYIGTDRGVYLSPDYGMRWTCLSGTMPTASVQRLRWAGDHNFLIAATHGLSLFKVFIEPVRHYVKTVNPEEFSWLGKENGYLPHRGDFNGDWQWKREKDLAVYWNQPAEGDLIIEFCNESSQSVFHTEITGQEGFNRWSWNMILSHKPDTGLYPIDSYTFLQPGVYTIKLLGFGTVLTNTIRIY